VESGASQDEENTLKARLKSVQRASRLLWNLQTETQTSSHFHPNAPTADILDGPNPVSVESKEWRVESEYNGGVGEAGLDFPTFSGRSDFVVSRGGLERFGADVAE
jgi:hypothetical protein